MKKDEIERMAATVNDGTFSSMKVESASVSMVVHRAATNTDEDYGLVSYYNRNPLKHYPINFMIWLRGIYRWLQFWLTEAKK